MCNWYEQSKTPDRKVGCRVLFENQNSASAASDDVLASVTRDCGWGAGGVYAVISQDTKMAILD
jgi:hypothetical protein